MDGVVVTTAPTGAHGMDTDWKVTDSKTAEPSGLSDIRDAIRSAVAGKQRIVARQYIEKWLSGRLTASEVTNLLRFLRWRIDRLEERGYWHGTVPTPGGGKPTQVYCFGAPPKDKELAAFSALVHEYYDLIDRLDAGAVAEQYVRSLLVRSKCFADIPWPATVGYRGGGRNPRSDLRVSLKTESGNLQLSVEVKNLREVIHSTSPIFVDLLRNALEENGLPVLFTTEVSTEMAELCEALGVVVIQLRRRIFPKRIDGMRQAVRTCLDRFVNITGPIAFECLNPDRPFQHPELISEATVGDLDAVSHIDRFLRLNAVWDENRALARQFVDYVARFGNNSGTRLAALKQLRRGLAP